MDKINFGNKLKVARLSIGYTQEEVCKQIKISRSHYSNIEQGNKLPGLELLVELSNILNVSPTNLLVDSIKGILLDSSIIVTPKYHLLDDKEKMFIEENLNSMIEQFIYIRNK